MKPEVAKLKKHFITNLMQVGVHSMLSNPSPRVVRHFQTILNQIKMEAQDETNS